MQNIEEMILNLWASHFQCAESVMQHSGTTLLPNEKYAGQNMITLWHIGEHTFARFDPAYSAPLNGMMVGLPNNTSVSGDHIQKMLPANTIVSHDIDFIHYLHPSDLPKFAPPNSFSLRQLALPDQEQLSWLHDNCTPEEVDNGFVEIDHEIVFGCFHNDQLVAAASGYRMTGFMDIGVLTHSNFRKLGLGRAVVGALCEWTIAQNLIAQYRCNSHNIGSLSVARSLNYRRYFYTENLVLM